MIIDWKETYKKTKQIIRDMQEDLNIWSLLHQDWEGFMHFENYPPRIKIYFRHYANDQRRKEIHSNDKFYFKDLKPDELDELTDLITGFVINYGLDCHKSIYKGKVSYTMWIKQISK